MDEVVITGMGIVCPIGIGTAEVWRSLADRISGVRRIPELEAAHWPTSFGGRVRGFDPKQFVTPRKSLKVMAPEIQFAFGAAEMACQQAGLVEERLDPERFGVVVGAGLIYCDLEEIASAYQSCMTSEGVDMARWGETGIKELYPLWMLKYLPNMPACHIGIRHDARGPTNTISHGDVSSLVALGEAADVIRRGDADVMIAGGVSSRVNLSDVVWHRGARASCRNDDPGGACRPFDADRDGMVYGEGAAQFVLESRRHAQRRGATPLASVRGVASRYEATTAKRVPQGHAIRRAIEAALEMASVAPSDLAYVNAHGNSTREDDPTEAQAIHQVLGDVPVTAPKSFIGNLGAGGGAVEMAVSLLAMNERVIPPTLNYETADPECPVRVATELTAMAKRPVLLLNHNATGQAAAAVLVKEE